MSIREAKQRHESEWLAMPEVVSVGIGKNDKNEPAIIIGVKQISMDLFAKFPAEVDGYPVHLQAVGDIRAQ